MRMLYVITLLLAAIGLSSQAHAFPWGYPTTSDEMNAAVDQQEHPEHQGEQKPPPGKWQRPPVNHNHGEDPHHYVDHPGYKSGWHYDNHYQPQWYRTKHNIHFEPFRFGFGITVISGYWQCTAFNQDLQAVSDTGPTLEQAQYAALYSCGGPGWQAEGCYIPPGYCNNH
jgi:hypothetical protein